MVEHTLMYAVVGTRDIVARGLAQFVEQTGVDEVIATGHIYDHAARLHSFEILAEAAALNPLPR
jgi:alkanesulfonate monooxygenase SsuD/methylene tetrahydromethanopterin reductase-like flavin-dependent oxidoreductase (luciferase family)